MVGKKGMSPIIATILLIAFAVALGAFIMQWSIGVVEGNAGESACQKVQINLRNPICYDGENIKLDISHVGSAMDGEDQNINALRLSISSPDVEDITILKGDIEPGTSVVKYVSEDKPTDFEISVVPMINLEGQEELHACLNAQKITTELPSCR